MQSPINYHPDLFKDISFEEIDKALIWENYGAPRSEAYYAQVNVPYTYGKGIGERTYWPHVVQMACGRPDVLANIWFRDIIPGLYENRDYLSDLELLFCNRYADQHQHLGWHADDSLSVDAKRPIVVITFGAEREIWFKEIGLFENPYPVEKLTLQHGSVLVMPAGMQQTHLHRIPKHSRPCGPRISLTFRGLTPGLDKYEDKD